MAMDIPLEIAFHNIDSSAALEARIRDRVARMQKRFNHINSAHVVMEAPHRSKAHPLGYHVRIEVRVPDKELVVSRDPGKRGAHFDPYVTIRDAFDAIERKLEQHSQKVRGDVKLHATALQGLVRRLFDDHGFIATHDGREIYFHRNAVVDGQFDDFEEGTPVELSVAHGESPIGPQASTVRPIRPMNYVPNHKPRS